MMPSQVSRRIAAGCLGAFLLQLKVVAAPSERFTVIDEIGISLFSDPGVRISPDQKYVAVATERGLLDANRVEGVLRFYRLEDIEHHIREASGHAAPQPAWTVTSAVSSTGPAIHSWRWLADSSGVAFLEHRLDNTDRLKLADVVEHRTITLTPAGVAVADFDVRNRTHYVYTTATGESASAPRTHDPSVTVDGVGKGLDKLLFPIDGNQSGRFELWAVNGAEPFRVARNAEALLLFEEGSRALALSPDGNSVVTAFPVLNVPEDWKARYPPFYETMGIRARAQNKSGGADAIYEYVIVELSTGAVRPLDTGPTGRTAGWNSVAAPAWSADGQQLLLPDVFLPSASQHTQVPCVALLDMRTGHKSCIQRKMQDPGSGVWKDSPIVKKLDFAPRNPHEVIVRYYDPAFALWTERYRHTRADAWHSIAKWPGEPQSGAKGVELSIAESFRDPPVLIATDRKTSRSRVVLDPNPHVANMDMGGASLYRWRDDSGRNWQGGLYTPSSYTATQRYPVVIQTHGFRPGRFLPSGVFTTAFAARALASAGIVVLQAPDCPYSVTPAEIPCNVQGYVAAVKQLIAEGIADPDRVGITGFSRTCMYVTQALVSADVRFKAASITDGAMLSYMQYITNADIGNPDLRDEDAMVGSRPFGAGLQQWLKQSPIFNMDKVTTPLMIVSLGRSSLLAMWEPYAALRYLRKPVDLLLFDTNEHELTNPRMRLASQGGSVDWFRFWLQDREDQDSSKSEQYERWRQLRSALATHP